MFRILIAIACFLVSPVSGQLQFASLEEMFQYADSHAVAIRTSYLQEQIAASDNRASKIALLPSVNTYAGFNDNITLQPTLVPANLFNPLAPEGTYNEYVFGRNYQYTTSAQASWDILNFQKLFDLRTTNAVLELNKAKTEQVKFQVYNQLAQVYYSILLTEKHLQISKENVLSSDTIYTILNDKFRFGLVPEEIVNRSRIQQIQAVQQLNSLTTSLEQLYNQLQSLLNTPDKILLSEHFSEFTSLIVSEDALWTTSPEIVVQQAQLNLNENLLEQVEKLYFPTLTVGYQYNYTWAGDQFFNFSSVSNLPQQFWGIKLNVPVFNGFDKRQKVQQADVQLQMQQLILENKKLAVQKEDENLKSQFRQALDELKKQEEIVALQQKNDLHTSNKYSKGLIGADERLDRFADLLQVQNIYMQCLSNYYISYYKLLIRKQF